VNTFRSIQQFCKFGIDPSIPPTKAKQSQELAESKSSESSCPTSTIIFQTGPRNTRCAAIFMFILGCLSAAAIAKASPQLTAVSCGTSTFTGSGTAACSVYLSAPTSGKVVVSLSSNNAAVRVPSSVTVRSGASTTGFSASVSGVTLSQTATITASAGSVSRTFLINLKPNAGTPTLGISTTSIDFGTLTVGQYATKPLVLTATGTAPVTISSISVAGSLFTVSGLTPPATLNPGQSVTLSVQFYSHHASSFTGVVTISSNASNNPNAVVNLSGTGTTAVALSAISCNNATMTASGADSCTVTLNGAAPSGGLVVSLSSNNGVVSVPAAVTVPANATSAGFWATVSPFTSPQSVTLAASAGGVSKTFALQLSSSQAALSINATSVAFGSVVLNSSATQSVTLKSTGTSAVTVNSAAVTGSGFSVSGSAFPVTLSPGQSVSLSVQFSPKSTGSASGQLTINSNATSNPTAIISLSGTGAPHEVDLTWNAPSGSIAGYHVYRTASGGSSYQLLNSSCTDTSYADTTVQSGQAYDYIVKSVNSSGVESAASNKTSVQIP